MKREGYKTSRVMELYKELKSLEKKYGMSFIEIDTFYMENVEAIEMEWDCYTTQEVKLCKDYLHYHRRKALYFGSILYKRLKRIYKNLKAYSETEAYIEKAERALMLELDNPIEEFIIMYEKWGELATFNSETMEFFNKKEFTNGKFYLLINFISHMNLLKEGNFTKKSLYSFEKVQQIL